MSLKEQIEKVLSEILTDVHGVKVTLKFEKVQKDEERKKANL